MRLKNQLREIVYFVISADLEKVKAEVTQEQIHSYYEANKHLFRTPERVKLSYLELREQDLIERIEVDEKLLQQNFEEHADLYVIPEQRRARHILLKLPSNSVKDVKTESNVLRQRAEQLISRLRAGEDFALLAEQNSEDALSAEKGGELGLIAPGDMDSKFEEVLFALEVDQISDPIETEKGVHIVQLTEVIPSQQKSLDQVRDQVALDYKQRTAEAEFLELTEQLLTLSYEQPDSLAPAAEALALTIKDSDWLTREQGEGVGSYPKVRQEAFNQEVLQQGRNSDLLEVSDGHVLVIRIKEHENAKPKTLEEVESEVKEIIAENTARDQAAEKGENAIKELRAGSEASAFAQKFGAELVEPGYVTRDDTKVPEEILSKAFVLRRPGADAGIFDGLAMSGGDYAVISLKAVREDEQTDSDSGSASLRQFLDYGERELEATFEAMKTASDVRIQRENFENR